MGPLDAIADALCESITQRPPHPALAALLAEPTAFRAALAAPPAPAPATGFIHPATSSCRGAALTAEAAIVLDTGANTLWAAQYLELTRRQRVIVSSHLGTMRFALPAAIAMQLAKPGKPVIAICGDGGFQMTVGDLATAVQQHLPLVIVVFNNGILPIMIHMASAERTGAVGSTVRPGRYL